jgi:hypothetical protein
VRGWKPSRRRWPPEAAALAKRQAFCDDACVNPLRDNPLNPRLAEGVRRVGFRKWYERELLSSHAHMVLCVLAVIGLIGSMEGLRGGTVNEQLLNLLFVIVTAAIGLWALRRYMFLLLRAEELANQAVCEDCGEYGRFSVVDEDAQHLQTRVCCLRCAHKWVIRSDAG